jgi:hypothetical protein
LNSIRERIKFILRNLDSRFRLTEQRNNSLPRVSSDDGDNQVRGRYSASDFGSECRCADDVEGCHTEEFLGVEYVFGFENFGNNGDGGVNGVGDDEDEGVGAGSCNSFG